MFNYQSKQVERISDIYEREQQIGTGRMQTSSVKSRVYTQRHNVA